jgi:hypothetical protein
MGRIAGTGLAGWGAIMALGWWLADRRAGQCSDTYNCTVHELGTRDAFLVFGLLVPFLAVTALAFIGTRQSAQARRWPDRDKVPLLARTGAREAAQGARLRPLRRLQGIWLQSAPAIGVAFALGWLCAYVLLVWMPERSAATAMTDEARDAAAAASDAAALAADAAASSSDATTGAEPSEADQIEPEADAPVD